MIHKPDDSDLLVEFERDNIEDDYRVFYSIKRNNFFSSIQSFPEHWEFFCRLDEIWKREISDLEVATDPNRMFPVILYMNAHAKMRLSMELAFSNCMPERAPSCVMLWRLWPMLITCCATRRIN